MRTVLILLAFYPTILVAQQEQKVDLWKPLRFFEGRWEGTGNGEPGNGTVKREYRFMLRGKLLEARNTVTYTAQGKNPKGAIHEDVGLFGYDRSRKRFVLRQFHVEGFVNQHVPDSISTTAQLWCFSPRALRTFPQDGRHAKPTASPGRMNLPRPSSLLSQAKASVNIHKATSREYEATTNPKYNKETYA